MMTPTQIQAALADRKPKIVAQKTGLSYQTVWRIASGNFSGLNYETVKALSDYLQGSANDAQ
jgi:DNA-binding Xre family transcriptional regulator